MGCVLCNIIKLSEEQEPFPSESARQDFMNELAKDIATMHPDLVEKINDLAEHKLRDKMYEYLVANGIIDDKIEAREYPPSQLWEIMVGQVGRKNLPESFMFNLQCSDCEAGLQANGHFDLSGMEAYLGAHIESFKHKKYLLEIKT